jgi:hypothetical protein
MLIKNAVKRTSNALFHPCLYQSSLPRLNKFDKKNINNIITISYLKNKMVAPLIYIYGSLFKNLKQENTHQ